MPVIFSPPRMLCLICLATLLFVPSAAIAAWSYNTDTDPMTSKKHRFAMVASPTQHDLGFPYRTVSARLLIRKHPRHGRDIMFIASGGQIPCHSYSPCVVLLRFDEKPPIRVTSTGPSDGSSTTLFLSGYDKLLREIKQAKTLRIEVEFFSAGSRMFIFDVAGFDEIKFNPDAPKIPAEQPRKKPLLIKDMPTPEHSAIPIARQWNCFNCHQIDQPSTAPSFLSIAQSYRSDPTAFDRMPAVIRKGGTTNWGPTPKPETQHLSVGESIELTLWILQLQ